MQRRYCSHAFDAIGKTRGVPCVERAFERTVQIQAERASKRTVAVNARGFAISAYQRLVFSCESVTGEGAR